MSKNISPDFRKKRTFLFVFQKRFKKRKVGVKIPLIEGSPNMDYNCNLKMNLINKIRRINPVSIPKNGILRNRTYIYVRNAQTLLLS